MALDVGSGVGIVGHIPRGLSVRYKAGDSLAALAATFTRATARNYFNASGVLASAASGVQRDAAYLGGVGPVLLMEDAATNLATAPRDLTNAAYTKTSCTAALDQTGIDGAATSASSLLATGANATCLQAITNASNVRQLSAYVQRLVGTGAISMTMDNGVTWTDVTASIGALGTWARVSVPQQTLANPTVGFKIATSGDKIAVDYVQPEVGAVITSPCIGTVNADTLTIPWVYAPGAVLGHTIYLKFIEQGSQAAQAALYSIGALATSADLAVYCAPNFTGFYQNGSGTQVRSGAIAGGAVGSVNEVRHSFDNAGNQLLGVRVNGGAESTQVGAAQAIPVSWHDGNIYIGPLNTKRGYFGLQGFGIAPVPGMSMDYMKGMVGV